MVHVCRGIWRHQRCWRSAVPVAPLRLMSRPKNCDRSRAFRRVQATYVRTLRILRAAASPPVLSADFILIACRLYRFDLRWRSVTRLRPLCPRLVRPAAALAQSFFVGRPGSSGLGDEEGFCSLRRSGACGGGPEAGSSVGVPEPGLGRLSLALRGWPTVSSLPCLERGMLASFRLSPGCRLNAGSCRRFQKRWARGNLGTAQGFCAGQSPVLGKPSCRKRNNPVSAIVRFTMPRIFWQPNNVLLA